MKTLVEFLNESIVLERYASQNLVDNGGLQFTYERDPETQRYSKRLHILELEPTVTVKDLKKLTVELPDVKPSWGESGWSGEAADAYIIDINLINTKAAKEIEKNRADDMTDYLNDVFGNLPKDCMVNVRVSPRKQYWRNLQSKWFTRIGKQY